jgi:anti-sigma regulatory factor (Ser/Thr protein kinase)
MHLEMAPEPSSVAAARHALDRLEADIAPDQLESARLLLSELLTNSLRHAGLLPDQRIGVTISATDRRVRVEVLDQGPGFSPVTRRQGPDATSGWGLLLVDRLADRWGVDRPDGRTRVWFEIDRS